jgi:aldehyde:ferredoxin oxidoreductase
MPGYPTGPGSHLGYLTGARHSHLDSAGYSLDQNAARSGEALRPQEVAESLLAEERWRQVLTSLPICLFARGIYTPEVVLKALSTLGIAWTKEDLERLGRETLHNKYAYKLQEGFTFEALRLPRRIFETPAPAGGFDETFMRAAIEHYAENL